MDFNLGHDFGQSLRQNSPEGARIHGFGFHINQMQHDEIHRFQRQSRRKSMDFNLGHDFGQSLGQNFWKEGEFLGFRLRINQIKNEGNPWIATLVANSVRAWDRIP